MAITKSIGKNTLGGGNKMEVDLRTYNRSTHNLSRIFRSTMSVGTLVPALVDVATPGDTWEMDINASALTLPTVGPLFGRYKLQIDVFTAPMRLYIKELHNNQLGIGLDMKSVKLPMLKALVPTTETQLKVWNMSDEDNWTQINPSCLLNYLGIKGWCRCRKVNDTTYWRPKNALGLCTYWDIVKNYYINKQEPKFQMIGKDNSVYMTVILPNDAFIYKRDSTENIGGGTFVKANTTIVFYIPTPLKTKEDVLQKVALRFYYPTEKRYILINLNDIVDGTNTTLTYEASTGAGTIQFNKEQYLTPYRVDQTCKAVNNDPYISIDTIDISELDKMRDVLLTNKAVVFDGGSNTPKMISALYHFDANSGVPQTSYSQYGLALKTHQSDIFNNWVNTDWIDGENGINAITAIDTSKGEFTIDQFNLAKKVYDMLNRIAVSGGTYKDWVETVYTSDYVTHTETPMYEGGYSADVEFQEVVSTAATEAEALGTLAGRGRLTNPRNGKLKIKVAEPSIIMAIASLTPYCDYSQGEEWFVDAENMDDWHKPQLDGIGYQDLPLKKMAWWANDKLSAGKQPAWIDYMTSFNRVHGEFAKGRSMAFMVLQREYIGAGNETGKIDNVTSYINPNEFNYIFADSSLDAQNFWVQIGFKIEARRKMSAKQIPTL